MKMRRCFDETYYRLRHPDVLGNAECNMLLKFQNIINMLHMFICMYPAKYKYEDQIEHLSS